MSGTVGSTSGQFQPNIGQIVGAGNGQVNLGSSEYHFNQVLDLVAPNGQIEDRFSPADAEMLDAESMERVAMVAGGRGERTNTWKMMAHARTNRQYSVTPSSGMGQAAYRIYSGTSNENDIKHQKGFDLVSSSLPVTKQ